MRAFYCVLAIALLFAPAAFASPPLPYKLEDCSKSEAQMDMTMCAGHNADAADAALNKLYQRIMAQQSDRKSKDQLRDVERAWIAYRDKECAFELGPQEDGGSIWPMDMSDCLRGKTDARIRELQAMAQ